MDKVNGPGTRSKFTVVPRAWEKKCVYTMTCIATACQCLRHYIAHTIVYRIYCSTVEHTHCKNLFSVDSMKSERAQKCAYSCKPHFLLLLFYHHRRTSFQPLIKREHTLYEWQGSMGVRLLACMEGCHTNKGQSTDSSGNALSKYWFLRQCFIPWSWD